MTNYNRTIFSSMCMLALCWPTYSQDPNVPTKKPIKRTCSQLNNDIVTNVDKIFLMQDCVLRPVKEMHIANVLMHNPKRVVKEMTNEEYASFKIGKEFTTQDLFKLEKGDKNLKDHVCKEYNNKIVTTDNEKFYLIKNCQKALFANFNDVDEFNKANLPLVSIDDVLLDLIPATKPIIVNKATLEKELYGYEIFGKKVSQASLCAKTNKKIVSFSGALFYVENCVLRKIIDISVELQQRADLRNGPFEISASERVQMKEGKAITSEELMKIYK